jgi:hypothetical protein
VISEEGPPRLRRRPALPADAFGQRSTDSWRHF